MEIKGISSMATRLLLAELVDGYRARSECRVTIESIGGVEASNRIQAGEAFDLVILSSEAIDALIASGFAIAGSKVDLVKSGVAAAVRADSPRPDIATEESLKRALLAARSIGYSTGPSGLALARLFERWGMAEELKGRIVLSAPGVPVGTLVASGAVELGFQQLSELLPLEGITILGPLPGSAAIITTFSGALTSVCGQPRTARAFLGFLASAEAAAAKRRQGMEPA